MLCDNPHDSNVAIVSAITGGEGGHDFDLSIDGTFSGGSARQTITESTEIKVNDAVTDAFERESLHAGSFNNGSMTIEIDAAQCTTANSLEFR